MGSLTALLNLSRESLLANQEALNITSNNVANQNTPGYTREVATWQTFDSVTINGISAGIGSNVSAVSQRDRVLEQRVQQQTQLQAQSAALSSALSQVENIFGLSSTSTSAASTALGSSIDSFFNSLSALSTSPADTPTRQSVLASANTLAGAFNAATNQLANISSGLDQQASTGVSQINHLTSTIASLNQQIAALSPNSDAGILEDQRQQAIAQLSQHIGLDQVSTENNGITLTTANGALLVSGSNAYAMTTANVAGVTHILAGPGSPQDDVTASITGGQLGGILNARDQRIPSFQNQLDQLAYAIGSAVNQQNQLGVDANGNPGQPIFNLPATAAGSAAAIAVAITNPQLIAAAAVGEGASGSGNALSLSNLTNAPLISGETASNFFASFLGSLGTAAASASTNNTAQQATLAQLTTQRNSLSGVSLDEEAANLTQYQRAYEAASKVFSIVDTLLASAINLGEPTTVS
jgi:flagellar hook-associated protein 1 FlgK